ncbi:MAG: hypothetical protein V1781_04565, partial [Bacteroidota bacterium]
MKNIFAFNFLTILLFYILFSSCSNNRLDVDVSKVQVESVKIGRFDRDFFLLNANNIVQKLPELQKKYHGFSELFISNIFCHAGIQDDACIPEIIRFVSDADMHNAYNNVQKKFPNLNYEEEHLTDAFRHFKYYFSEKKIPVVLAMMSGFNYSIVTADSIFAIGLEMYMGSPNQFYEMIRIPLYKRKTMSREFIVSDFVRVWMMKEFPDETKSKTLLNEMIYNGKLLYLVNAFMPNTNDTIIIGFTKKQITWCSEHESDMWGYLIKNKFLYSGENEVISKFTTEGPFTTGFVKESPARTGIWLGWQIVRKYMNDNPSITLQQLMDEKDSQMILSKSKYKP